MNPKEIKSRQVHVAAALFALAILTGAARLTGYNGITYIAVALEVYGIFYAAVSGGVSEALGKFLKKRNAKGQYRYVSGMRRYVLLSQAVLGAAGTAFTLVLAGRIAEKIFQIQYSTSILMVMAPAIFLRAVSESLSGCCRGEGAELPAAASGILRQLLLLVFGMLFCRLLGSYGDKVSHLLVQENFASMYSGVGIAMAVTLSELFTALFLLLICGFVRRSQNRTAWDGMKTRASFADSVMAVWSGRNAQAGTQLVLMLSLAFGLILCGRSAENGGLAEDYGTYLAGYGTVCGFFAGVVIFLLIPVCGKAAVKMRREEHRYARMALQSGIHIGAVHSFFFAAFLAVMAEQAGAAFCGEQAGMAAKMFRGGSVAIVFAVFAYYFSRMMLLIGKKYIVLGAAALGAALFTGFSAVFLRVGKAGVLSLVYAGLLGGGAFCLVTGALLYRQLRLRTDWLQTLAVPAGLACATGFVGMLLGRLFTPHLGDAVAALVCFVLMSALYWTALLLFRNFTEQELELVPGGKVISAVGQMLRVF